MNDQNEIEICPHHNKAMRYHPKYGWSCPTKVGEDDHGQAQWCNYKPGKRVTVPRTTSIAAPAPTPAPMLSTPAPSHASKSWAWGVACDFAGRVYAGTGDAGRAEAIKMAQFVVTMISHD